MLFLAESVMSTPEVISSIVQLLAGLGMLLIGFKLLSDNIEKLATGGLKKMFNREFTKCNIFFQI